MLVGNLYRVISDETYGQEVENLYRVICDETYQQETGKRGGKKESGSWYRVKRMNKRKVTISCEL